MRTLRFHAFLFPCYDKTKRSEDFEVSIHVDFPYYLCMAISSKGKNDLVMMKLISGQFATVEPLVVMIFSCLGLFPLLFASLIMPNDSFKLPGWPFSLLSFGLGAFALLPYFVLKGEKSTKSRGFSLLNKWLTSPTFLLSLLTITLILYLYGFAAGSFSGYIEAFKHSELVSVMTVDFFVLTWLTYILFRGHRYRFICVLPILGPLVLLLTINQKTTHL